MFYAFISDLQDISRMTLDNINQWSYDSQVIWAAGYEHINISMFHNFFD